MKPAAFDYARPSDLDEACAMLAAGDEARIIAGGQTLVPLMAMRLARPRQLIDIGRIPGLAFVREEGDAVAIGATTRQCVLDHDPLIRAAVPLLSKVMPFVGHAPIRARGTVGGSLANADPAAEIALVAVTLDATLVYREGGAIAEIAASDFFVGPMMTACRRPAVSRPCVFRAGATPASASVSTRSMRAGAISPSPRRQHRLRSPRTAPAAAWPSASAR
jgi:CO/xanthine dehydrogenase FAD-binding subunit